MGTIQGRNGMDLTEGEAIKKSDKNTQMNYTKKIFMTQIIMMVWSTNLEPDILECDFKWALGGITMKKAGIGGGIPVELF